MDIKKEDLIARFNAIPKRKLTDIEKQAIFIIIEKNKIQRERAKAVFSKGFLIFFAFILIVSVTKLNEIIPQANIMIIYLFGIIVLIVTSVSYNDAIRKEEKTLDALLESFLS